MESSGCLIKNLVTIVIILLIPLRSRNKGQMVLGCHPEEREALMEFKGSLTDLTNRLSSWNGEDCCRWRGVTCHNVSRHVLRLDLRTAGIPSGDPFAYLYVPECLIYPSLECGNNEEYYKPVLRASKLDPSLVKLTQLRYLDLSANFFNGSSIPLFLGSLQHLRYLNLSNAFFSGIVPSQLGNLTRLQVLDLHQSFPMILNQIIIDNLYWVSTLVNLHYLDLSGSFLSIIDQAQNSVRALTSLPSLIDLRLSYCNIDHNLLSSIFHHNSTLLSTVRHLDVSSNFMGGPFPIFLANMSSLTFLDLSSNYYLNGSIPLWLRNMSGLEFLNLGYNSFSHVEGGTIMGILGNLCNLKVLDFSHNSIHGGEILSPQFENLSNCISYDVQSFDLASNNITGALPYWFGEFKFLKVLTLSSNTFLGSVPTSFQNLSLLEELSLNHCGLNGSISFVGELLSLKTLNLKDNSFNGIIPSSLGRLSFLTTLDLSGNSLQGILSDSHLYNLSSLKKLDLSFNPLSLNLSTDFLPKFQLTEFRMRSCKIKTEFPQWMKTQNKLTVLDLSNNEIYGELPRWFSSMILREINLSCNHIIGSIPHFPSSSPLSSVDLSNNSLSGSILQTSICELRFLSFLNLQRNQLSGTIPDCWGNSEGLSVIDLSSNQLYGTIPMSIGLLPNLAYLKLNNNFLEGSIPKTINAQSQMVILDLGENKITGEVPNWNVESHPFLTILRLRGNQLQGVIPSGLCLLPQLQYLDLAKNKLTGSIPRCLGHLNSMKSSEASQEENSMAPVMSAPGPVASAPAAPPESFEEENAMVVLKGQERQYTSTLKYFKDLDFSCNDLEGSIPEELIQLSGLIGLNLSYNHLTGSIPEKIGEMSALESLDLSNNNLTGTIPSSMVALNFLDHLNLSYNKLHGEIPTGNQLQTLQDQSSIYKGNPGLCGDQLPKKCLNNLGQQQHHQEQEEDDDDNHDKMVLYVIILVGFATGFWVVVGSLVFKKRWRYALFNLVDNFMDYLFVHVVVRINRSRK